MRINNKCNPTYVLYIILFILVIIYFYFYKYKNIYGSNKENFIPKIKQQYRHHSRNVRLEYEQFVNKYGNDFVVNKLKKWNIF